MYRVVHRRVLNGCRTLGMPTPKPKQTRRTRRQSKKAYLSKEPPLKCMPLKTSSALRNFNRLRGITAPKSVHAFGFTLGKGPHRFWVQTPERHPCPGVNFKCEPPRPKEQSSKWPPSAALFSANPQGGSSSGFCGLAFGSAAGDRR